MQKQASFQSWFEEIDQSPPYFIIPDSDLSFLALSLEHLNINQDENPKDVFGSHSSEKRKQNSPPTNPIPQINAAEQFGGNLSSLAEEMIIEENSESTMALSQSQEVEQEIEMNSQTEELQNQKDNNNIPQKQMDVNYVPSEKNVSNREDDNNNSHKKFITILNEVLKQMGLVQKIKMELKKAGLKFPKGSRYAFVTRLIDVRELYGNKMLFKLLKKYCEVIANEFQCSDESTPSEMLLHRLVEHYTNCCALFYSGKIQQATEEIYNIKGAKEQKYKKEGIKRVLSYMSERFPSK